FCCLPCVVCPAERQPARGEFRRAVMGRVWRSLGLTDVRRLKPLRALGDLELDLVPLGQALEALGLDGTVVDEDVLAALDLDETVALRVVEPLDRALCHTSVPSLLERREATRVIPN